jgi:hypothetical protein
LDAQLPLAWARARRYGSSVRLGFLALIATLSVSGVARADSFGLPLQTKRISLAGEFSYYRDSEDDASRIDVLAPLLEFHYPWSERWSLSADFGMLGAVQTPDRGGSDFAWRPGNPTAFALLRGEIDHGRYRVGVGGAAPLAVIERDSGQGRLQHAAYNDAQGLHGLFDLWLWAPSRGALLARGQLELDVHPQLRLELEAVTAVMIPAREAYLHYPVVVLFPLAAGFSTGNALLRGGVRLQAVIMPANDPDALQVSIEPWLRVMFGRAFIEARYTGNVDEPLAGERGPRIWGFHLSGGGVL